MIRRGNDTSNSKVILETWNDLSLDPKSNNYINKVIGDSYYEVKDITSSDPYLQLTGDFANKSTYVYVQNNLKTVVIVSGFNDVLIDKYVENKPLLNPPLFYQNKFNDMNKNLQNSFFKNLIDKITFKNIINKKPNFEIDKAFDWKENFSKNLKVWASVSNEFNFKIIFALQPYYKWSKNSYTTEEAKIFNEIEAKKIRTYQVLKDFNQDEYLKTEDYFKRVCKKNNISYLDLNKVLKFHDTNNNWLFVDALHLTDLGYKIVSEEINFLIK